MREFSFSPVLNQTRVTALLLLAATLAVYFPVVGYEFADLDDDLYVFENRRVQEGLSWDNLLWSFTTLEAGFWHPLVWLSHMLDVDLYGSDPGGHHLSSLLFHCANVILLFHVLHLMTGAKWQSAVVATLFALHPLNVESVAWIAERKNVLSTFLWLLVTWAYVEYTRRPDWIRYFSVTLLFILGLMAKPMLVTLPCVFLLLDYWPLRRIGTQVGATRWVARTDERSLVVPLGRPAGSPLLLWRPLLLEKLLWLAIAVGTGFLAILAQARLGALKSIQEFTLVARLENALVAYVAYLGKMIWPVDLAVFYPHPLSSLSLWQVLFSALLLLMITVFVLLKGRSFPYLAVGWFWYMGTLLPVSGLIQVGGFAMADRFAYVPLIGVFILVVWGVLECIQRLRIDGRVWLPLTLSLAGVLAWQARVQLAHWQSGVTLLEHTVRTTEANALIYNNLGTALLERGRIDESIHRFQEGLTLNPRDPLLFYNLGLAFRSKGEYERAFDSFQRALEFNPHIPQAHNNLGVLLLNRGELEAAAVEFSKAVRLQEDFIQARRNLAFVRIQQGKGEEAAEILRRILQLNPNDEEARKGLELLEKGTD